MDKEYIQEIESIDIVVNKLASSKLRFPETMTYSLTHPLTGVKCRATSVAKNDEKEGEGSNLCGMNLN